jgi:hypothetical protein
MDPITQARQLLASIAASEHEQMRQQTPEQVPDISTALYRGEWRRAPDPVQPERQPVAASTTRRAMDEQTQAAWDAWADARIDGQLENFAEDIGAELTKICSDARRIIGELRSEHQLALEKHSDQLQQLPSEIERLHQQIAELRSLLINDERQFSFPGERPERRQPTARRSLS